jgi:hypothetical protein
MTKGTNKTQKNTTINTKSLGEEQLATPTKPRKIMVRSTNNAQENTTKNTNKN